VLARRSNNQQETEGLHMQRRTVISTGLLSLVAAVLMAPAAEAQFDAMSLLGRTLGLSSDQLEGGVGSILTLAQEKLVRGDYDKVAAAIPGASKYLDKAKQLGAVTGPVGDVAGLNSALGRLGIDQETAARLVPAVKETAARLGGGEVGTLLSSVLGT
jgi:hypothetical protein